MKKLFVAAFMSILMISCGNEDEQQGNGNLKIVFKANYDGSPLVMYDEYDYDGGTIFLSTSEFYVSNFELQSNGSDTGFLSEVVDYLDFTETNDNVANAEAGITVTIEGIPSGTYNGLNFGMGLDESINSTKPEDYASSNVMQEGDYWPGWTSFIFSKLQGTYNDNQGVDNLAFLFHLGRDDIYRTIQMSSEIEIRENETTEYILEIDHKELFTRDGEFFSIKDSPINHTLDNFESMEYIADNFQQALKQ